jgi:hypothetical protein
VLGGRERVDAVAVGLPRATLRSPRTLDLEDGVTGLSHRPAPRLPAPSMPKTSSPASPEAFGPALQLGIAGRRRRERELAEQLTRRSSAAA